MKTKFEALKHALFMEGIEAIEDFLGYEVPIADSDDVIARRIDLAREDMSREDFDKFFQKYLPDACVCRDCGKVLDPDEDIPHVINPGLASEYTLCETCHGNLWDTHDIINCVSCGAWFDAEKIASRAEIPGFAPCPACCKDIAEGITGDEIQANNLTLLQSMADTDMTCHGHLTARTSEALEEASCWFNPETNMVEDSFHQTVNDYSDPVTIFLNELVFRSAFENAPFEVAMNDGGMKLFSFVPIQERNAKLIYLRKTHGVSRIDQLMMSLVGIVRHGKFLVFDTLPHCTDLCSWSKWDQYLREHPNQAGRFQLVYERIFKEVNSAIRAAYDAVDVHGYLTQMDQQKIMEIARRWQFSAGDGKQDCWNDMMVPSLDEPSLDGIIKVYCGTFSQETLIQNSIAYQAEKMRDHKARANHFRSVIDHKAHAEGWEIFLSDALASVPGAFSVTATFELNGKTASAEIRPSVILSKLRLKQFYTKQDFCTWKAANELFRTLDAIPVNLKSENIIKISHNNRVIYKR